MSIDYIAELTKAEIRQKENVILKDVDLQVSRGEFIYLIGKVGSGKSSLLKTLYAELPLEKGKGSVVGHTLDKIKKKEIPVLRRKLGIVFQDFQLLTDRSVNDNLAFVLKATGWKNKAEINRRIAQALEKVNMQTKGYKMPHQLSGGEQQRIAIARALLNAPELILADEPTGNLDPETSNGLMELLHTISSNGRAVIMATHNYNLIEKYPAKTYRCADRNLVMQ